MKPENEDIQNIGETPQEEMDARQEPEYKKTHFGAVQKVYVGIKPGYILRKVGQAFMVMPTGPRMKEYQGMITLNETGAFLFKEAQKEEPTNQKLIDACIAEYGATPEEAKIAVDAFMIQCVKCGLMEAETVYYDKRTGKKVTVEEMVEVLENEPAE